MLIFQFSTDSASVVVHVIREGEHPAAMQHGINSANLVNKSTITTYVIITLFLFQNCKHKLELFIWKLCY